MTFDEYKNKSAFPSGYSTPHTGITKLEYFTAAALASTSGITNEIVCAKHAILKAEQTLKLLFENK